MFSMLRKEKGTFSKCLHILVLSIVISILNLLFLLVSLYLELPHPGGH